MKLNILIGLFLTASLSIHARPNQKSSAEKRLSSWQVKYCENNSKRGIASECPVKPLKKSQDIELKGSTQR